MGIEVSRVPPNWIHPQDQPMFDQTYASASREWREALAKWGAGERPRYFEMSEHPADLDYWEYEVGPPDRAFYRPWADDEATWFQAWETVTEGTPVTPPFETTEELVAYLAEHGDFWDQYRALDPRPTLFGVIKRKPGQTGWGIERATAFVKAKWASSFMTDSNGVLYESRDIALALEKEKVV